jgi:hypothetical protein
MKMQAGSIILISMIASITFGIIDALNFFFVEDSLNSLWKTIPSIDQETIPIINGGISAAISIVVSFYVEKYISAHYKVLSHPAIDALGVIIGTLLVIFAYILIYKERPSVKLLQSAMKSKEE